MTDNVMATIVCKNCQKKYYHSYMIIDGKIYDGAKESMCPDCTAINDIPLVQVHTKG